MARQFSVALRNARAEALDAAVGANGILNIYSGTKPANVAAALSGNTLLASLTCASDFAAAAASGVLTANAITQDSSADATGTASFYRLTTSGGTVVEQGDIGTSGSDLNLTTTSIVAGQPVQVTSWVSTEGGA